MAIPALPPDDLLSLVEAGRGTLATRQIVRAVTQRNAWLARSRAPVVAMWSQGAPGGFIGLTPTSPLVDLGTFMIGDVGRDRRIIRVGVGSILASGGIEFFAELRRGSTVTRTMSIGEHPGGATLIVDTEIDLGATPVDSVRIFGLRTPTANVLILGATIEALLEEEEEATDGTPIGSSFPPLSLAETATADTSDDVRTLRRIGEAQAWAGGRLARVLAAHSYAAAEGHLNVVESVVYLRSIHAYRVTLGDLVSELHFRVLVDADLETATVKSLTVTAAHEGGTPDSDSVELLDGEHWYDIVIPATELLPGTEVGIGVEARITAPAFDGGEPVDDRYVTIKAIQCFETTYPDADVVVSGEDPDADGPIATTESPFVRNPILAAHRQEQARQAQWLTLYRPATLISDWLYRGTASAGEVLWEGQWEPPPGVTGAACDFVASLLGTFPDEFGDLILYVDGEPASSFSLRPGANLETEVMPFSVEPGGEITITIRGEVRDVFGQPVVGSIHLRSLAIHAR